METRTLEKFLQYVRSGLHSRKYGPVLSSCKVTRVSEHINRHRLKCHATLHEASKDCTYKQDDFTPAKPQVTSGLSLDVSRLDGWRLSYVVCQRLIMVYEVSRLNFDNVHLYTLQSLDFGGFLTTTSIIYCGTWKKIYRGYLI